MQIKEMTVGDVFKRGVKKIIMECASVKFWGAIFLGFANWHIIHDENKFDVFGITAFLVLLGIREAADLLQRKEDKGGELK
jgi:hypothetical protein